MLSMDFRPRGELGLVLRLESLFAIPPGAAAIEIISNIRGADHGHLLTTAVRNRKVKYSTNFLIYLLLLSAGVHAKDVRWLKEG
jgi:hypothetical protein